MPISKQCIECGKDFKTYNCHIKRGGGIFCSLNCHGRWNWKGDRNPQFESKRFGSKNPNWKNGSKKKNALRFSRKLWQKARVQVLGRDNYICQVCEAKENLAVHHLIPYREKPYNIPELLVTLCNRCHLKVEAGKLEVPFIGVAIPSRGLVHSRTIESLYKELAPYPHIIRFTHDLPIPESHNSPVEELLKIKAISHILFIEEDMLIPKGAIKRMFRAFESGDYGVVAVDYPVGQKRCSTVCRKGDKILWTGLGCTMIHRNVFEKIGKPWFSTDKTWRFISKQPLELLEQDVPNKYGGHDIYFGMQCQKHNILIYCVDNLIAGHIKPKVALARHGHGNSEIMEFEIWDTIEQYQNYE